MKIKHTHIDIHTDKNLYSNSPSRAVLWGRYAPRTSLGQEEKPGFWL